jgi:hypothetical protein
VLQHGVASINTTLIAGHTKEKHQGDKRHATMDIIQAVSGYITKMVSVGDNAATGTSAAKMKILLLDNETVGLSPLPEKHVLDSNTA